MRLTSEEREALQHLGHVFDQDTFLIHGSLDEAIADMVDGLDVKERLRLRRTLERLLATCSNAELKGHFNRSGAEAFINARGARMVFETALKHTTERRHAT